MEDRDSDITGLVRDIVPEVPIAYTMLSFSNAPYIGLRLYECGYVKEGVGAGGTTVIAQLRWGLSLDTIKEVIYGGIQKASWCWLC
jgi:NaMN:DMB phosphoribosyltransferase